MRLVKHPVLCNYYVTYRCNATCSFCDIWEKPSPYVTLENFKSNLADLRKLGVRIIDFTGGEPLLHREIATFASLAKEQNFITTLTTNCLLYPKIAEKLKGKVDMLHFSLDASQPEQHNNMRGVSCFDFVMNSIDIAKNLGERPDILFTAFDENFEEIERVYHNICLPNGLVLIINPSFDYNEVDTGKGLSRTQLNQLKKWGTRKNIYLNQAFIDLRQDGGNHVSKPVCKAASTTIVISPENKLILPCYHLGTKSFDIEDNLMNLYNSVEVQNLAALEGRLPGCEGCTINCYMQPSFATNLSKYWLKALPSTIKYNYMKGTWKALM